ncbi:SseB family protein [Cellulomonas sp. PhB143]|uniref:SseB family protein n=1 Tax=Cellulomonas sp. PhB143 TaxID=2485186 RepID=UPI000F4A89C7|nr:SseB family protein [Cellulomonas sp. PhB143]ROS77237.1 type III secretion system (T3SS) SseB-like protein [Cellulomonas sp. PhB143]
MSGRALPPSSSFAGDDGSADPALAAALEGYAAGSVPMRDVVAALAPARVLVPVLAEAEVTEEGEHGTVDREASSGVVALESPDGRRALPVFTSVASMAAWRADARPVPVEAARAAQSAVSESWALLVVDPAGPHTALVPRPAVWAIGQGRPWSPAVEGGLVDPEVSAAIEAAVGGLIHVGSVRAEPGRRAEVAVVLAIHSGLDRAGLDLVLSQVNAALAKSAVVGARVDSLELRIGRAD